MDLAQWGTITAMVTGLIGAVIAIIKLRNRPRLKFLPISAAPVKPKFLTRAHISPYLWGEANADHTSGG
jgi:hypothetical protein